jgi:putative two-component system response regulator
MGYPCGISGKSIPLEARIAAIADMYDALTSDRPYHHSLPGEEARKVLRRFSGIRLDPELTELFLGIMEMRDTSLTSHPVEG